MTEPNSDHRPRFFVAGDPNWRDYEGMVPDGNGGWLISDGRGHWEPFEPQSDSGSSP